MGKCKIFPFFPHFQFSPIHVLMERTYIFKIFYSDFADFIDFSSISEANQLKFQ